MKEEWKDIKGYEGLYQVSNLGRVKSLGNNKSKKEKILDPKPNMYGYKEVRLSKEGKRKPYKVHRLVAIYFIPNPNNYKEVNHKDEDKTNNHVSNLEWCDRKYNINYGTRNKKASDSMKGKNKGISRNKGKHLTEEHKKKISESHKGKHLTEETKKKISKTLKEKALSKS